MFTNLTFIVHSNRESVLHLPLGVRSADSSSQLPLLPAAVGAAELLAEDPAYWQVSMEFAPKKLSPHHGPDF